MINQREVRVDTEDFGTALRAAMRQDPDVILVGEMRDQETVKAALAAAETGHFVMSTLHTVDAQETINAHHRLLPAARAEAGPAVLAGALRGIICQRLVPRADGKGRCVAMEVCINTGRVADAIEDPDKTGDHHLADHRGRLLRHADLRPAPRRADPGRRHHAGGRDAASSSPHDLTVELRRLGLVA